MLWWFIAFALRARARWSVDTYNPRVCASCSIPRRCATIKTDRSHWCTFDLLMGFRLPNAFQWFSLLYLFHFRSYYLFALIFLRRTLFVPSFVLSRHFLFVYPLAGYSTCNHWHHFLCLEDMCLWDLYRMSAIESIILILIWYYWPIQCMAPILFGTVSPLLRYPFYSECAQKPFGCDKTYNLDCFYFSPFFTSDSGCVREGNRVFNTPLNMILCALSEKPDNRYKPSQYLTRCFHKHFGPQSQTLIRADMTARRY